jgi:hypothetical protein
LATVVVRDERAEELRVVLEMVITVVEPMDLVGLVG